MPASDDVILDAIWDILDDHGHNGIDCRYQRPIDHTVAEILAAVRRLDREVNT